MAKGDQNTRNLATHTVSFFSIKYRIEHESSLMHANLLSGLPLQLGIDVHGVPVEALDVDARMVGGRQAGRVPRRPRGKVRLLQEDDVMSPGSLEGKNGDTTYWCCLSGRISRTLFRILLLWMQQEADRQYTN